MHDLLDGKVEIAGQCEDTTFNEDELWKSFDDLKSSLKNMDISGKLLQSLIKPEKVSEEFRTPTLSRILPPNSKDMSRKPLLPAKSGQSTMSSSSSRSGGSQYQCPQPNCSFKTTKDQLKNTRICVNHFMKDHKLTGEMIRREKERGNAKMLKFIKVK